MMNAEYGRPYENQDTEYQRWLQSVGSSPPPSSGGSAPWEPWMKVGGAPPPAAPGAPGAAGATGWGTPPTDGNWQQWFATNWGKPKITPAELAALAPELQKAGVSVVANGKNNKIMLPGGQIVDVIQASGNPNDPGYGNLTWDLGGGAQSDGPPITVDPSYLQPFTEQFQYGDFQFNPNDYPNDPSYQWNKQQALGAMENSAAAKGVLNTGGNLYNLGTLASGLATQGLDSAYNRAYSTYGTNQGNAWKQFVERKDTFMKNQDRPWNKLYQASSLGQQAASA